MLFGTYQQIPKDDNMNIFSQDRHFNKYLGYAPIWAFPITDYKESIIHSLISAPNYPDIFYIIETDDYERVDKIRHYQNIALKKYNTIQDEIDYRDIITDKTDDMHSEFLLNPEKLNLDNIKRMHLVQHWQYMVYTTGFMQYLGYDELSESDKKISNDFKNAMLSYIAETFIQPDMEMIEEQYREAYPDANEGFIITQAKRIVDKTSFEIYMLPFILNTILDKDIHTRYLASLAVNAQMIFRRVDQFSCWSYEPINTEEYDYIIDSLTKLIINDDNALQTLYQFKLGRNEPCPCGSGKKFKKCCGRYIGGF